MLINSRATLVLPYCDSQFSLSLRKTNPIYLLSSSALHKSPHHGDPLHPLPEPGLRAHPQLDPNQVRGGSEEHWQGKKIVRVMRDGVHVPPG